MLAALVERGPLRRQRFLAHEQLGEPLAQPSGVLRPWLPVDFATTYLAPLIAEFARRHPGISFDFDLTPRRVDLVSEPFDVAIRMGELNDSNLIARLLARLPVGVYASPRYLEFQANLSALRNWPSMSAWVFPSSASGCCIAGRGSQRSRSAADFWSTACACSDTWRRRISA